MEKYKYENYDYSKVGIKNKKWFLKTTLSNHEFNSLVTLSTVSGKDASKMLTNVLKKSLSKDFKKKINYDPNFEFEWEIVTPINTFKFDESFKK